MKKTILDLLKTKFPGVSDAILSRIADNLAKTATTAEEAQTAVDGVTFQSVLESYGDSRATEAQQTAVKNYEKKHGIKDGKPQQTEKPAETQQGAAQPAEGGAITADAIRAIIREENAALREEVAGLKAEKTAAGRKATLAGILKDAPESVRLRYEKDFARMSFTDDEDFNGWITEITPDVEKIATDFAAKGGVVGRPKAGAGNGSNEPNPHLQARINERKAAVATPAIHGLPTQPTTTTDN